MFTSFDKSIDSKLLYFKLGSSFQIVASDYLSDSYKLAGLYSIYKDGICYYVGQSQNIASRISQHISGKYSSCDTINIYAASCAGFEDFYSRNKESRKAILEYNEMILMQKTKPIENLITPGSDFHYDENKVFSTLNHEDFIDDTCANIYIDENSITVSEYIPEIYEIKCFKDYINEVVEIREMLSKGRGE